MISLFQRIALFFKPWRPLLLGASLLALAAGILVVTEVINADYSLFKPLLLVGIWLLLLASVSYSFAEVPEQAPADSGLIYRWMNKFKRFICFVFACFFILVSLLIVIISVKGLLVGG